MRWYLVFPLVLTLLLAAALPIMAHNMVEPTADQNAEQLQETIWAYEEAFKAGDVEKLVTFFAEDAYAMPPDMTPLLDKPSIEHFYANMFEEQMLTREFRVIEVTIDGNHATRLGEWTNMLTPVDGGEPTLAVGHCMFGFEFDGIEWKVAWQIWNYVQEAPPALSRDGNPC